MSSPDAKADLHRYLQVARDALVWKLDGLDEYDVRRPLVRTGTNLLGLLKHAAGVEAGYLGLVFDRPFPEPMPWMGWDADPDADLWATSAESREDIVGLARRVWEHGDATIAALELDATGSVPWWGPEGTSVTLHRILVHLTTELHRHAGHADILRESIDGAAGFLPDDGNLSERDAAAWAAHHAHLEQVARQVGDHAG